MSYWDNINQGWIAAVLGYWDGVPGIYWFPHAGKCPKFSNLASRSASKPVSPAKQSK